MRAPFQEKMFGPALYEAFCEVKSAFDPSNMLNPGKIVHAPALTSNLRFEAVNGQADGSTQQPPGASGPDADSRGPGGDGEEEYTTKFDFSDFGGLLRATEQCSGVGACRKTLTGTMCPSYMATRNEIDSTRGRANALRVALSGGLEAPVSRRGAARAAYAGAARRARGSVQGVDMARLKSDVFCPFTGRMAPKRTGCCRGCRMRAGGAAAPVFVTGWPRLGLFDR